MDWISRILVTFLVNSIVQVAIIAGLALLCSVVLRRAAAKYQYALWIAALLLSSLLPLWSLKSAIFPAASGRVYDTVAGTDRWRPNQAHPKDIVALGLWSRLSQPHEEQLSFPPAITVVLAGLYAAFLVYRVVCLGFAWRHTRKLYDAAGNHSTSETVCSLVERNAKAFRLKRAPRIYVLDGIGPLTVGARQPILLVPATFLETASEADLDSAVCHELAHISRRDFQMNLICELASLAVSFHPAAWLIKSRINQTRELACDDLAAEKLPTPTMYAGALVHIAQSLLADSRNVSSSLAQGLFDTDNLERRISHLIEKRNCLGKALGRILTVGMVGGLVGVTLGASAFSVQMRSDRKPAVSGEPSAVANESSSQQTPSHNPSNSSSKFGAIDVLSDTKGVDFGPYLKSVLKSVRENWHKLVPDTTRKGSVSIEFAVLKSGKVTGTKISGSSGDVALDRAALGGIAASNPFPPLPTEFGGEYLRLRFHFYYNPNNSGSPPSK
jgi:TonB family protein